MSTQSTRHIANRAEDFARALRRLADTIDHAARVPAGSGDSIRAHRILDADRAEAIGAGNRLAAVVTGRQLSYVTIALKIDA